MNIERLQELSGILKEEKPSVEILTQFKELGKTFITFVITFPSGAKYKEEYSANPYIISEFKKKLKHTPLKAYKFIKDKGSEEKSSRL